jgi:hypothetical protein
MKQPEDSRASQGPGTRPPDYAIVVCASDRVRERFPDSVLSLSEALQNGKGCGSF